MQRYTSLFTDGQAYISIRKLSVSRSGEEIVGEPVQQFALYEASGYEPAEILMMKRELDAYRKIGFTPEQLSRILKGVSASNKSQSGGALRCN